MPQEFYLTGIKELFDKFVRSVLMYMEITLKNNVIVLSVPFVHHTEVQNFLIAPRIGNLMSMLVCLYNCETTRMRLVHEYHAKRNVFSRCLNAASVMFGLQTGSMTKACRPYVLMH